MCAQMWISFFLFMEVCIILLGKRISVAGSIGGEVEVQGKAVDRFFYFEIIIDFDSKRAKINEKQ